MKLVRMEGERIGLLVQLSTGPHTIDIVNSLGIFAVHDPLSGGILNGALKEQCSWTALVNHWHYLHKPLELLARTALNHPDDPPRHPAICARTANDGSTARHRRDRHHRRRRSEEPRSDGAPGDGEAVQRGRR
jgi:hypothetical protein